MGVMLLLIVISIFMDWNIANSFIKDETHGEEEG